MNEDSSTHFDARRPASALGTTIELIRAQWSVFIALIVVAWLVETLSFGLVFVDAIGTRAINASIASISIFVVPDAQASHDEVDALGPLISATPGISRTTFRSKDDAIKGLVAKGLPPPDGRNPLPDLWIAHFDPGVLLARDRPAIGSTIAESRRVLKALPRVDSVTTDEVWLSTIDGLVERWQKAWPLAFGGSLVVMACSIVALGFVSGRAMVTMRPASGGMRALAFLSLSAGVIVTGASLVTSMFLTKVWNTDAGNTFRYEWNELGPIHGAAITLIAASIIVFLAVSVVVGGRRKV